MKVLQGSVGRLFLFCSRPLRFLLPFLCKKLPQEYEDGEADRSISVIRELYLGWV